MTFRTKQQITLRRSSFPQLCAGQLYAVSQLKHA